MRKVQTALSGRLRLAVVEEGQVVEQRPWQDNLILDQGLDKVASVLFNQLFASCAVGSSNSPTSFNTGFGDATMLATVSGQNFTAAAGCSYVFSNNDLDSSVHFQTGQLFKIQSVVSGTQITLFTSGTISTATPFAVLRTNQAALGSEIQRTNVCSQVASANQTIPFSGGVTLQRTFLFPPETSVVTYKEAGFSDSNSPGPNLFSRVVFGQPVTVQGPVPGAPMGQRLQITYQLSIGIDYGQGAGNFFSGTTPTSILATGLPILYSIWAYQNSAFQTGWVDLYVSPRTGSMAGDTITVSGSTISSYDGTWQVQNSQPWTDATNGNSTVLTIPATYASNPGRDGGAVAVSQAGAFFRPCVSIFGVNSSGGSAAPPDAGPDLFLGYGEPSIAGTAWIGKDQASSLGSNGVPLTPQQAVTAPCTLQPYTAGNYYIDKQATLTIQGNNPIYSFGIGEPDQTNQVETWTWDQAHMLGDKSTFVVTFRFSWARMNF